MVWNAGNTASFGVLITLEGRKNNQRNQMEQY